MPLSFCLQTLHLSVLFRRSSGDMIFNSKAASDLLPVAAFFFNCVWGGISGRESALPAKYALKCLQADSD